MAVFDCGCIFPIHMIAMQTPADNSVEVDLGAPALAVGRCCVLLLGKEIYFGHHLRHAVLGARPKLHRAIAVVIVVHGQTADAEAVSAAFVLVPLYLAPMPIEKSVCVFWIISALFILSLQPCFLPEVPTRSQHCCGMGDVVGLFHQAAHARS
jgi:hypothetical protein